MSKKSNSVPRLDLAPKLKRPLSLWNPLDYLRLLYWVFFFPQSRLYYADFLSKLPSEKQNQRLLLVHSIFWGIAIVNFVTLICLIAVSKLSQFFHYFVQSNIAVLMTYAIAGFVILALYSDAYENASQQNHHQKAILVINATFVIVWANFFALLSSPLQFMYPSNFNFVSSVIVFFNYAQQFSALIGLSLGLCINTVLCNNFYEAKTMNLPRTLYEFGLIFFVLLFGAIPLMASIIPDFVEKLSEMPVFTLFLFFKLFFILITTFFIVLLRLDNWLMGLLFAVNLYKNNKGNVDWRFPCVTLLPLPYLSYQLKSWLRRDWEMGIHNAKQIFIHSMQFTPVINALNQVLNEMPREQAVYRVATLITAPCHWELVFYISSSLSTELLRLDTPVRASAAGFCYLKESSIFQPDSSKAFNLQKTKAELKKAAEAFALVRSLPYGEEMFVMAQTFLTFIDASSLEYMDATTLKDIAALQIPDFPGEPLLRSKTWEALASLRRIASDIQIIQSSSSPSGRAFALSRAVGELKSLRNNIERFPEPERVLIAIITFSWSTSILDVASEVGKVEITKKVRNPYTIGDPVVGKKFVGREDIIRDLTELWILGDDPQSIVLYGHRRMGKTSILLNIANLLGAKVKLAYINLLRIGSNPQGVGEVLIAITDAIAKEVNIEPPADADLLNLPYRNFERYLNRVIDNLDGALIVALDEFEKIEELIANEKIPPDFMGFLRGMVQMNPKLAFALAGLHTLEEMTEDYFHPFFASIIPIPVGFLTPGATRQILANPGDEDFLLDYEPQALDRIYQLTNGQPYLVQLVGFLLVRRYNELTFETGRPQKNVFTIEDVEAVIDNPNFYSHGRYYFTGVWDQAAQGAKGQQQILTALAANEKEGLTLPALGDATGMDTPEMQTALDTLDRHDVVKENDNRWQIAVELLRRWVANR